MPKAAGGGAQEAGVAEDLKLLADFVPDVAIAGMKFFKMGNELVDLGVGEFRFSPFRTSCNGGDLIADHKTMKKKTL